jgi:hypothetical protein
MTTPPLLLLQCPVLVLLRVLLLVVAGKKKNMGIFKQTLCITVCTETIVPKFTNLKFVPSLVNLASFCSVFSVD